MPSHEPAIARSVIDDDDLAPAPIDPAWIVEGAPVARARAVSVDQDGSIRVWLWECSAGRFDWRYGKSDETVHILAGEAELTTSDGSTFMIRAGDVVHFPNGETIQWFVPRYIKKVAFFSSHVAWPRRMAQRVPFARRVVHTLRRYRAATLGIAVGAILSAPDPSTFL
jgi:uncharacterized protein